MSSPNYVPSDLEAMNARQAKTIKKMRDGYQRLHDSTDTQMGDGDLAREIAAEMLAIFGPVPPPKD